MSPGKTQNDNLMFVTFVVNTLTAVYRHNALLKASIMSATNAHRLGANEAPPAIISSFLGKQLTNLLDALEKSSGDELFKIAGKTGKKMLDMPQIPELLIDNTDRNRTSPFAFTGNRFEFRAVGSEANCASAMIALNTAVAEQLIDFKKAVDKLIASGMEKKEAIIKELQKLITYSKPIRFDGNGYSDEWKAEAARRGLDCETCPPEIFKHYTCADSVKMFETTGVMNQAELAARNEIKWEIYTKKIQIEARIFGDMAINHIIPVATSYQSDLIDNVYKMKGILGEEADELAATNIDLIKKIAKHVKAIEVGVNQLVDARKVANVIENEYEKAMAYYNTVVPKMEEIRHDIDKLEEIVDDRLWPLPKYRELLFVC
jgi:glutamine synthetase